MLSTLDKNIDKDVKMKFVLAKKKAFLDEANSLKFYISGNKKWSAINQAQLIPPQILHQESQQCR